MWRVVNGRETRNAFIVHRRRRHSRTTHVRSLLIAAAFTVVVAVSVFVAVCTPIFLRIFGRPEPGRTSSDRSPTLPCSVVNTESRRIRSHGLNIIYIIYYIFFYIVIIVLNCCCCFVRFLSLFVIVFVLVARQNRVRDRSLFVSRQRAMPLKSTTTAFAFSVVSNCNNNHIDNNNSTNNNNNIPLRALVDPSRPVVGCLR